MLALVLALCIVPMNFHNPSVLTLDVCGFYLNRWLRVSLDFDRLWLEPLHHRRQLDSAARRSFDVSWRSAHPRQIRIRKTVVILSYFFFQKRDSLLRFHLISNIQHGSSFYCVDNLSGIGCSNLLKKTAFAMFGIKALLQQGKWWCSHLSNIYTSDYAVRSV